MAFADASSITVSGDRYFGSDHSPVFSLIGGDGGASAIVAPVSSMTDADRNATIRRLIDEVRVRLDELERLTGETF